jgi:hypothetical protein
MRIRTLLLVLAVLAMAGFVALNINEFARDSVLNLGLTRLQAPLGLVMLLLLIGVTVIFLGSTLLMQSKNLLETRTLSRELTAQRELADRAEASRFTELRNFLQEQAQDSQRRDSAMGTVLADRFAQEQHVLLARMEQLDKAMSAYVGQLEDRIEGSAPLTDELMHHNGGRKPLL